MSHFRECTVQYLVTRNLSIRQETKTKTLPMNDSQAIADIISTHKIAKSII